MKRLEILFMRIGLSAFACIIISIFTLIWTENPSLWLRVLATSAITLIICVAGSKMIEE